MSVNIAAFVVSCLSVLIAAGALWYVRGQKLAAQRSAEEAAKSAQAAAEVAAIERERRTDELADAQRKMVLWELRAVGKDNYRLVNRGTETAYDVEVDGGDLLSGGVHFFAEFPSGHEERVVLVRTFGTRSEKVTVTWRNRPDLSDEPMSRELLP